MGRRGLPIAAVLLAASLGLAAGSDAHQAPVHARHTFCPVTRPATTTSAQPATLASARLTAPLLAAGVVPHRRST